MKRTDDSHPDVFVEDGLHDCVIVARVGLCDDLPSQTARPARARGLHGVREADADARLVAVDDPDAEVARALGGRGERAPVAVGVVGVGRIGHRLFVKVIGLGSFSLN